MEPLELLVVQPKKNFEFGGVEDGGCAFYPMNGQGRGGPAVLEPLRKVTLCVGPNNSGKSRFLRALAEMEVSVVSVGDVDRVWLRVEGVIKEVEEMLRVPEVCAEEAETAREAFESMRKFLSESAGSWRMRRRTTDLPGHDAFSRGRRVSKPDRDSTPEAEAEYSRRAKSIEIAKTSFEKLKAMAKDHLEAARGTTKVLQRKVYIPPIRALRKLQTGSIDSYLKSAYGLEGGEEANLEVFTGSTLLKSLTEMVLGGAEGRRRLLAFESFLSSACFAGRQVGISPKGNDENAYVEIQIGDDEPRHIDHLGDGISQVVLLTFPLFRDPNRLFLIEEPETHLHPGLQRAVIALYAKRAGGPVFVSTHSNHLVDLASETSRDTSVLRFQKSGTSGADGERFIVSSVDHGDLAVLDDLGVRVSSVSRVNAVLWVEGPTDRLYILRLISLLDDPSRPLLEYLHFGFAFYGRSTIVHHSFSEAGRSTAVRALRLAGSPIVVADHDGGKAWRDSPLMAELGDRFHRTPGREIENLLPPEVLRRVLVDHGEAVDVVEGALPRSRKADEVWGTYRRAQLGRWLDQSLGAGRKCTYSGKSGTITKKLQFSSSALRFLTSDGDLSPAVRDFGLKLIDQVRRCNSG